MRKIILIQLQKLLSLIVVQSPCCSYITGCFGSCMFMAGQVAVQSYFHKKRSLASSIAVLGTGVGKYYTALRILGTFNQHLPTILSNNYWWQSKPTSFHETGIGVVDFTPSCLVHWLEIGKVGSCKVFWLCKVPRVNRYELLHVKPP